MVEDSGHSDDAGLPDSAADELAQLDAEIGRLVKQQSELDAEISRLSKKRDEQRARLANRGTSSATSPDGWVAPTPTNDVQPANWLRDPFGLFSYRYWDGTQWTKWVARGGVTYEDPITSAMPPPPRGPAPVGTPPASSVPSGSTSTHSTATPSLGRTARPEHQRPALDLDAGQLILLAGAVLFIGGLAGLTVWLWDRIPAWGQLAIFGFAFVAQTAVAWRLREKLSSTAEAIAATGAATLIFTVGSLVTSIDRPLTTEISIGLTGAALLIAARFRAWVYIGHLALLAGMVSVLVEEPRTLTAVGIFLIIMLLRFVVIPATKNFRGPTVKIEELWLAVAGYLALVSIPIFAFDQLGTIAAVAAFIATVAVASELTVRVKDINYEQLAGFVASALLAVLGFYMASDWWWNGSRADGVASTLIVVSLCLMGWRLGKRIPNFARLATTAAVAIAPFALRFLFDRRSTGELITFCGLAAVVGVVAARRLNMRLAVAMWSGIVVASLPADTVAAWPRLFLLAIGLASLSFVNGRVVLRFAAVIPATAGVANVLYTSSFSESWSYRPDLIGVVAALFLATVEWSSRSPQSDAEGAVARYRISTASLFPTSSRVISVPRFLLALVAFVSVPVGDVVSRPAVLDLPDQSLWRLGALGLFVLGAWVSVLWGRRSLNAARLVALGVVAVFVVSRVGDESSVVRTVSWLVLGAGFVFGALRSKKVVLLVPAALCWIGTVVGVSDILYTSSFSESWWFRPEMVGAVAAMLLVVLERSARRVQPVDWFSVSVPESSRRYVVPRFLLALVVFVSVPVGDVVSRPAVLDLPDQSLWRLGALGSFVLGAWIPVLWGRRSLNAVRLVALGVVVVFVVSRVGDESSVVRTVSWLVLGAAFVFGALRSKKVVLLVPAALCWTIAILNYAPPGPFEVLTISIAAVTALVAFIARRLGRRGSYDFIPATALVLVPSAIAAASAMVDGSVDTEQARRIAFVLVVGGLAFAVGTFKRNAALVFPSLVAVVMLAVAQLIFIQQKSSNWITALVVGALLLVAGARLEYLRTLARRGVDLLRTMR